MKLNFRRCVVTKIEKQAKWNASDGVGAANFVESEVGSTSERVSAAKVNPGSKCSTFSSATAIFVEAQWPNM